jgi:hypothetical protein
MALAEPVLDIVATAVFEDCHVAWFVTVCVVLFENAVVAVNCAESPAFAGAEGPVTVIEVIVGVGAVATGVEDGLLPFPPQPPTNSTTTIASRTLHARHMGPTSAELYEFFINIGIEPLPAISPSDPAGSKKRPGSRLPAVLNR